MPTEPFYDTSYGKLLRCLFGKPLLFQNNNTLAISEKHVPHLLRAGIRRKQYYAVNFKIIEIRVMNRGYIAQPQHSGLQRY